VFGVKLMRISPLKLEGSARVTNALGGRHQL
jgi:hypothetical protein